VKQKGKNRKRRGFSTPVSAPGNHARPGAPAGEAALRQNLRLKAGYDESAIERLIQLEREREPDATLSTLMEAAIERWERENR
jgi:hypothetical protein